MRKIFSLALVFVLFGLPGVLCAADAVEMTVSQEEKEWACNLIWDQKFAPLEFETVSNSEIDSNDLAQVLKKYAYTKKDLSAIGLDSGSVEIDNSGSFPSLVNLSNFNIKEKIVSVLDYRDGKKLIRFSYSFYRHRCKGEYLTVYDPLKKSIHRIPQNSGSEKSYEWPKSYNIGECYGGYQSIIKKNEDYYLITVGSFLDGTKKRIDKLFIDKDGLEKNIYLCAY